MAVEWVVSTEKKRVLVTRWENIFARVKSVFWNVNFFLLLFERKKVVPPLSPFEKVLELAETKKKANPTNQ
jgi:hypothetical protein